MRPHSKRERMNEPLQPRSVPFYGDELVAVQQPNGAIFIVFTRVCDALGLKRWSQARRVQAHAVLGTGLILLTIQTEGGPQEAQCLRLDLLPLWLASVQVSRVKTELQQQLVRYQTEAADVLWRTFKPQILVEAQAAIEPASNHAIAQLQQIAEMAYAIGRMAEQQIELQRQQQALAGRMDTAARIIKSVQGQVTEVHDDLDNVHVRLGVLEEQLQPAGYITEAQAGEVSNRVKALAELLTGKDKAKNHYQGIFGELYRRFGVSSYKVIRQEHYGTVLQFLDDWRAASGA